MTPINGQRLYLLNHVDVWAGEDQESCTEAAKAAGFTLRSCRPLTDQEANQVQGVGETQSTLAIALKTELDGGLSTPVLFARVEQPEVKVAKPMAMLPAAPGTCPVCATVHEGFLPHNIHSLFYQMRFNGVYGRPPTMADSAAHCTPEVVARWRKILEAKSFKWTESPEGMEPISEPRESVEIGKLIEFRPHQVASA